jgi:hypothetical protein
MNIIADLTSGAITGAVTSVGQLAKDIKELWTGEPSPEKQAAITQKIMELEAASMNAQIEVNKIEAASENLFVAGWRPFVGWVCGAGFAYATIIQPLMEFAARVAFGYEGEFPILQTGILVSMLGALLGVGVMRSWDKMQAPAPKGKE